MKPCTIRVPATPLVTHDPYFSVWSFADRMTDDFPRHWTGAIRGLGGLARIDGKTWAWLGPCLPDRMEQVCREIYPTRTVLAFRAGGVELTVTFLSPLLADDLEVLGRPLTYVTMAVRPVDGTSHRVQLYIDVGAEWATDVFDQQVVWMRHRIGGVESMKAGTQAQQVLSRGGDDHRCDWGFVWLAAAADKRLSTSCGADQPIRAAFAASGTLPVDDDTAQPRPLHRGYPKLAASFDLGRVGRSGAGARVMLAYEDIYCCEYMQRKLRPYWQRNDASMADLLKKAVAEYADIARRCERLDRRLLADAAKAGGDEYRDLCALAYRQAIAAHKLAADHDGTPLFFSKENFSNGCMATVDVTYPSAPLFLLENPALLKAMLTPVLDYAMSPRWRFPFAPHDLGVFPLANGQAYGGAETSDRGQMPVEECGNMILLVAAYCRATGDVDYARKYAEPLGLWAAYLEAKGFDSERQLCTDDFAGHLAHNANLSIKAILALAAYGKLAGRTGLARESRRMAGVVRKMVAAWVRKADDGDHSRLVFDKAGTWSQKYNLVWDRLLGLGVFPRGVARREVAYYGKIQDTYGLALDNRKKYGKVDWIVWSATLAEDTDDFRALLKPVHRWLQETSSRVPLPDLYMTDSGEHVAFRARSVVGGVFVKLLQEKWTGRP